MSENLSVVVNVPVAAHLADDLARIAGLGRQEAVAELKALRQRELDAIAAAHLQHLGETTGLDVVTSITSLTDAVVMELARRAYAKAGAPAEWQAEVGVFAVGGYGRGEMCPRSDLDLMVLSTGKPAPWKEAGYAELQASLWDVKFQVGASHRHVHELQRILDEDFVTGTAVIEHRPLMASATVAAAMHETVERFHTRRANPFLRYKVEELGKRRAQAGALLLQMEPNLKTNPGCLRDVQLLRSLAWAIYGSRNLYVLSELDSITRGDLNEVLAVNSHLMTLRCLLHAHHGRRQDVLQLADQVRIASQLGYADISRLRAVEHFMRDHYRQVRHVHQVVELAIGRLEALGHLGRRKLLVATRRKLDEHFSTIDGRVYLADQGFWRRADVGQRLLALCRLAQERGLRLSLELRRAIRANLEAIDDDLRQDREAARVFLAILGDVGKVAPILHDMHDAGLLGAYLPEFGNLTCLMQFDSYHQYTVDEHTLLAMQHLDDVAAGRLQGLPGMTRIFPTLARKDLLGLSLLLHDMGKYMGRGHVPRGAIMCADVAWRLHLDQAEEDLFYFLVERHVVLSDASRKRDFRAPAFLDAFVERIGTRERLDMLYCLTYCDAKAVGEGILTGWQEALLGELYEVVAARLDGGARPQPGVHERLRGAFLAAGVSAGETDRYLAEFSGTYEYQVHPAEAIRHFQVLREARAHGAGLVHDLRDGHVLLTAAVRDRRGLLADVAATLSGHGFDIIDARAWIASEGIVVYSYRLTSIYPARLKEEDTWKRLRADLEKVAAGVLDPAPLLAKRRAAVVANAPADSGFDDPAVKVEQRTSPDHTVVDVHAKDRVGLLSRLCQVIADQGCDIGYACISTMGDVAVDVFYVSRERAKLADEDADTLRRHLVAALELKAR